jgi:hypothetical protein
VNEDAKHIEGKPVAKKVVAAVGPASNERKLTFSTIFA